MSVEVCPICDIAGCRHIRERDMTPLSDVPVTQADLNAAKDAAIAKATAISPEDVVKMLEGVKPTAWKYRWKIDGEYVNWRYSDASNFHQYLTGFQELPLYTADMLQALAAERDALVAERDEYRDAFGQKNEDWGSELLLRQALAAREAELEAYGEDMFMKGVIHAQKALRAITGPLQIVDSPELATLRARAAAVEAEAATLQRQNDMMRQALQLDPWEVGREAWRMFANAVVDVDAPPSASGEKP